MAHKKKEHMKEMHHKEHEHKKEHHHKEHEKMAHKAKVAKHAHHKGK